MLDFNKENIIFSPESTYERDHTDQQQTASKPEFTDNANIQLKLSFLVILVRYKKTLLSSSKLRRLCPSCRFNNVLKRPSKTEVF